MATLGPNGWVCPPIVGNPVKWAAVPASATAAGNAGEIAIDANYLYVCATAGTFTVSAVEQSL